MQNPGGPTTFKANVTGRLLPWREAPTMRCKGLCWRKGEPTMLQPARPPQLQKQQACLCRAERSVPAPAWSIPHQPLLAPCFTALGRESSFLPVVLRSLELSLRVFMCRWGYSCSCAPETSGGFRFPEHMLREVGPIRSWFTHETAVGKKKELLLGLQPRLGAWEGVIFSK